MRRLGLSGLTCAALLTAQPVWAEAPAYAERIHVLYDASKGTVARRLVRVVDPRPEEGLDFTWEPAKGTSPGTDAEGFASGAGLLTWRIPGTPAYDPRAFHSRFAGTLRRGAPEGQGRMTLRDGSWMEGSWRAGLLHGTGSWQRSDGSRYDGAFADGLPDGAGVLRTAQGDSYKGRFRAGLPHGLGHWQRPGQGTRPVVMENGIEQVPPGAELLPAQGEGDAARVTLSVVSNARIALQQDVSYSHVNDGETLHLIPAFSFGQALSLIELWEGGRGLWSQSDFDFFGHSLALQTRAFLDISLATTDGKRVKLDALDLVVDHSAPHLRPMLAVRQASPCVGHRPWFDLVNHGWGQVEEPQLRVSFGAYDTKADTPTVTPVTDWVEVPLEAFDAGKTVFLTDALRRLGVDVDTLSGNRFHCPSQEDMESCVANLRASVDFGQLAQLDLADTWSPLVSVPFHGELSYVWTDAWGNQTPMTETITSSLALAYVEVPTMVAEMGDGGAFAAPAPDFQEIRLDPSSEGARVNLPLRGNPNVAAATAHVQLYSERSAIHFLHVEARLGDGSVQSSMPMILYFLVPRAADFVTEARPGACFVSTEY